MTLSPEARAVISELRAEPPKPDRDPPRDRADWIARALADPPPPDTRIDPETWAGIACERVSAPSAGAGGLILLLHGGGYVAGCPVTHRKLAARLSQAAALPVLVPDYRLAPENPAPAAVEDACAVTEALYRDGLAPGRLAVAGDSAGGGLALALFLSLKARGLPQPACGALMSPWTDILARGASYTGNAAADPSMVVTRLRDAGRLYTGPGDPLDPLISPIEADLAGLPPLLIQVGGAEVMLDDSTVFADRARAAGVAADCEVWDGLWHVFQNHAPRVPEAGRALDALGAFIARHLR
jgi:acetyl esterase/lipase